MPPRKTFNECREKISEMIGEAVVESDDARRHGLLTLADLWVEVAERRKEDEAPGPYDNRDQARSGEPRKGRIEEPPQAS